MRDSSILCKKVILEVVYRTLRCTHCNRVGTEKIDFLSDNGFRVSRRLEMEVIEDLERAGSIKTHQKEQDSSGITARTFISTI